MTEDQWKAWLDAEVSGMPEPQRSQIRQIEASMENDEYLEERREFQSLREAVSERNEMVEMEL